MTRINRRVKMLMVAVLLMKDNLKWSLCLMGNSNLLFFPAINKKTFLKYQNLKTVFPGKIKYSICSWLSLDIFILNKSAFTFPKWNILYFVKNILTGLLLSVFLVLGPFISFHQKTQSKTVNNISYAKQMTH